MATDRAARQSRPGGYSFESWHFFLAGANGDYLVVAPGAARGPEGDFAFIQLGQAEGATFFEYDADRAALTSRPFSVRVDESVFSLSGISLSIESEVVNVRGEVSFEERLRYRRSGLSDPFAGAGGMPSRHSILALRSACSGTVEINGRTLDFTGGDLYAESRRGKALAKGWLWAQASFGNGGAFALSALVDQRPGLPRSRIAACVHDGKVQRSMARDSRILDFRANRESLSIVLEDSRGTLAVEMGRGPQLSFKAPESGVAARSVPVCLESRASAVLRDRAGRLLYEGESTRGSLSLTDDMVDFLRGMAKGG